MPLPDDQTPINGEDKPLCPKCGSLLQKEGEELVCPKCDYEIDFFGEKEEEEL